MKRALHALHVVLALAASTLLAGPALADQALANAKNCMACHAVDKKLVGPSYKDVAARYANDKSAVDKLATKIIKGGSGVWGSIPMPPQPIAADEARRIAQWLAAGALP